MIHEFKTTEGGRFKMDFYNVKRLWQFDDHYELVDRSYNEFSIRGSINDLMHEVYMLGYAKCKDDVKTLYSEVDENGHTLKKYVMDERGNYINVNYIMSFNSSENKTVITLTNNETCFIDIPIDEFKEILAKAQEELK